MKRRELIQKVAEAAKASGLTWEQTRAMGGHDIWSLDGSKVSIPRHNELNEYTAQGILRDLESKLGKGWWR
jgi:hypothetical protein